MIFFGACSGIYKYLFLFVGSWFFVIFKMSWQAYVDQQMMDKKLKKAAIAGFDGNIWAKVGSLYSPHSEVRKVLADFAARDWWGYCTALLVCDVKLSQMEGNGQNFRSPIPV